MSSMTLGSRFVPSVACGRPIDPASFRLPEGGDLQATPPVGLLH